MKKKFLYSSKAIISVIHLLPLPGAPKYAGNINLIIDRALDEAAIYQKNQIDGIIIENFNDDPFPTSEITKEQLALMASIVGSIKKEVNIPIGVNVHFNDWEAEMAIGFACNAQFVRIEVFVDTVVTSSGIVEPCSADVTRFRKQLGIEKEIEIWADIHPKYSRNLLPTSLETSAQMAKDALADAIIVTGQTTGIQTPIEDLSKVKATVDLPVLAGSGTTISNVKDIFAIADGAIVGSAFKKGGDVHNEISEKD